jgi:hypothetical protein
VRDALVLAVYLSLLFLVAVGALTFVVTAGAAALMRPGAGFARRARIISSTTGWLAAIGCLAYLTFWWRTANAGFGWSAPVWTTFALVVAVLISFLLGHAVRIATLGVAAARDERRDALPARARASWRAVASGGAIAFAGAAALLVVTASADSGPPAVPALTVRSMGLRLKVIAIDGVDPQSFDTAWPGPPGGRAGEPGALIGERYELAPQDTTDPARAWTTIATGEPPEVHGVHAIETRRVAGLQGILAGGATPVGRAVRAATDMVRLTRPSIASRDERKSMMVWEVAEQAGLRTAVVNWWATWPAATRTGLVLTDRAILRLEHGGTLDAEIAPPELYSALEAAWPAIRQRARDAAAAAFANVGDADASAILRRSAELDATVIGLANALPGPARDLDVVYLPGLDIAQHALLGSDDGAAPAPSVIAARLAALRGYPAFLRAALDPWLHPAPGEVMVLVMQPGRVATPSPGRLVVVGRLPLTTHVETAGMSDRGTASVADVAPTILAALGVPLSRELPGSPRGGPFTPLAPDHYVSAYGPPFRTDASRNGQPLDQEMIDRLRSLGYVR